MIIKSISQLLQGRALLSTAPGAAVREACLVLAQNNVGALAVLEAGRLVGILSERDVITRCIAGNRRTTETRVADVMTARPVTIRRSESLATALDRMMKGGFRHLPVLSGADEPVGMLSLRDIPTEYRLMVERWRDYTDREPA